MAKPRGKTSRAATTLVGRGSSGYRMAGERYTLPRLAPLSCPACTKPLRFDKPDHTFECRRCGARFTPSQMQRSIESSNRLARRQEDELLRLKREALAEEDRIRRALMGEGHTAVVYYIRFRDAVKIGTSTDVANRLLAHPWEELVAIEPGGQTVERRRHRDLRAARIDGEWFELTGKVRDYIADINRVNAQCYDEVFACAGPLPIAKKGATFPVLSEYPPMV